MTTKKNKCRVGRYLRRENWLSVNSVEENISIEQLLLEHPVPLFNEPALIINLGITHLRMQYSIPLMS